MTSENLIHIKFEFEEALQSKRDALETEMELLKAARAVKKYRTLRLKELKVKASLYQRLKETKSNLKKLEQILPKIKIPKILEDKDYEKMFETEKTSKEKLHDKDIESQLREIQEKLSALQR